MAKKKQIPQFTVEDYNRINDAYLKKKQDEEIAKLKVGSKNLKARLFGRTEIPPELPPILRSRRSAKFWREDKLRTATHPIREQVKSAKKIPTKPLQYVNQNDSLSEVQKAKAETSARRLAESKMQKVLPSEDAINKYIESWKSKVPSMIESGSRVAGRPLTEQEIQKIHATVPTRDYVINHLTKFKEYSIKKNTTSEPNMSPKRLTSPDELAKNDQINKSLSRLSKTRKGIISTRSESSIKFGGNTTPLQSMKSPTPRLKTRIPSRTPAVTSNPNTQVGLQSKPKKVPKQITDYEGWQKWAEPISKSSKIKNIVSKSIPIASKIARNPIVKVASRIANSGVVRAAGTASIVIGAASDIMNISKATREVRKAIIHKGVESIPRKTTTNLEVRNRTSGSAVVPTANQQVANLQKAKLGGSIPIPKSQAVMNTEAGKRYGWGSPPLRNLNEVPNKNFVKSSVLRSPATTARVVPTPHPSGVDTRVKASRYPADATKPKITVNPLRKKTNRVSTPITPKRPSEITEDLSFLNVSSFTASTRTSPVRPIPTRVQTPEQFMSPSMSLATLPKINRYKLGVQR
jgi:hypothetical protein